MKTSARKHHLIQGNRIHIYTEICISLAMNRSIYVFVTFEMAHLSINSFIGYLNKSLEVQLKRSKLLALALYCCSKTRSRNAYLFTSLGKICYQHILKGCMVVKSNQTSILIGLIRNKPEIYVS